MFGIETIEEKLKRYTSKDYDLFRETCNTLIDKGVANGCYQDYRVLADIIDIISGCCYVVAKNEVSSHD